MGKVLAKHCAVCGVPAGEEDRFTRTASCCEAPWCHGAGRARYAVPEAPNLWDAGYQFAACCDAVAGAAMGARGTPRRVALW